MSNGKLQWHFVCNSSNTLCTGSKSPEAPPNKSPLMSVKSKSMDAPLPSLPPSSSPPPPPPHASTHSSGNTSQSSPVRRSPGGLKKPVSLDVSSSPVPTPRSPRSSPTSARKGYAELQFENGSVNTTKMSPVPERRQLPDAPNKFSYSKLQFEDDKEKECELKSNGKVAKKPPPAPPRYQGQMMKNATETNLKSPEQGAPKGRSKPNSLPSFLPGEQNLDYAQVVFSDNSRASPLMPHRSIMEKLSENPPQDDHPPPRPADGTVLYSTVILTQTLPQEVKKNDKTKDKPRPDGYENFDFNPKKPKDDGYVNFDFAPTSSKRPNSAQGSSKRPNSAQGPTVAGSARLLKNDGPQAKPR